MTGLFVLDWAILAASLFNTILIFWLGFTVLLNAERRTWGVWLIGLSLFFSGVFFISHTAIAGQGLRTSPEIDFWWQIGLWAVIALPFAWYVVMLWYAGFWDESRSALRRRQRWPLSVMTAGAVGLVGLLLFANPLPTFSQATHLDVGRMPGASGVPWLMAVYAAFILLCIVLALDAVLRPGPSVRRMGDLARRRARPWLIGATGLLLLVSLLVVWALLWISAQRAIDAALLVTLGAFDLAISGLIAGVVLALGQAIIAHEVFTGQALPRQGLLRYWRRVVILALGYGGLVGASLAAQVRPIYGLLLTALLMTAFYALVGWRMFAERERYIRQLRPFVASQRLYDHLVRAEAGADADARAFTALCADVLNAHCAFLIPHGPLAPLAGPPLAHPAEAAPPSALTLSSRFEAPGAPLLTIDPLRFNGAVWAAPLWSERGLIGLLLLGEKRDGGLYTDEEIEIARATGERLLDTQASAELTRRLMALQRERLAASQLLDRRARLVLHDDILPQLHAAILSLGTQPEAVAALSALHRRIADLLREMPAAPAPELARLGLFDALRHTITHELSNAFDEIVWAITPEAEARAQALAPLTAEAVYAAAREAIRNAARHGRPSPDQRALQLRVSATGQPELQITVEDNGVGIGEGASSGQGLALHSALMAVAGGALAVESQPGAYTRVTVTI
jgi:signal transduction histidine kinase